MCSRFQAIEQIAAFLKRLGYSVPPVPQPTKREIRPTDQSLILGKNTQARFMTWGLQADWTSKPIINARSETILEKNFFQPMLNKRCLVPASAWFEWRAQDSRKLKNRISIFDQKELTFAAIHDGARFCILTCPPHPDIAHIHSRMPVIIPPDTYQDWLDDRQPMHCLKGCFQATDNTSFDIIEDRPQHQQMNLF